MSSDKDLPGQNEKTSLGSPSPSMVRAMQRVNDAERSLPESKSSICAELSLWEACDPELFTTTESIWILANEGNRHFRLHIVGDISNLFRALTFCKVQRLAIERG